jgi:large subunit ribosomal protein L21
MMYAILEHGGHQYRLTTGDRLLVDRIPAEIGSTVTLEPVLLVGDDAATHTDAKTLSGARDIATVVAHRRGRKLRVFMYKPKKRRRRTLGYRSQLTELRVDELSVSGAAKRTEAAAKRTEAAAKPKAPSRTRRPKTTAPPAAEDTAGAAPPEGAGGGASEHHDDGA